MQKVELNTDELEVESFSLMLQDVVEKVLANVAPTARTFHCPCDESVSCYR